mmetsp:Transcript_11755/g.11392  ORF Transcript_11755/g.11392 Transcript_11755/m.11392 type:complete len:153 (-) Transcript_11755:842-1300(-)
MDPNLSAQYKTVFCVFWRDFILNYRGGETTTSSVREPSSSSQEHSSPPPSLKKPPIPYGVGVNKWGSPHFYNGGGTVEESTGDIGAYVFITESATGGTIEVTIESVVTGLVSPFTIESVLTGLASPFITIESVVTGLVCPFNASDVSFKIFC